MLLGKPFSKTVDTDVKNDRINSVSYNKKKKKKTLLQTACSHDLVSALGLTWDLVSDLVYLGQVIVLLIKKANRQGLMLDTRWFGCKMSPRGSYLGPLATS